MTEQLIIDENNFEQYYHDIDKFKPEKGEVLACYESMAEFIDGDLKRDLIKLLMLNENAGEVAPRLMRKLAKATPESALAVTKEMAKDLLSGMSEDEVAAKPYPMHLKAFYYTRKEYLPENDKHWWSMSLIDVRHPNEGELDEYIKKYDEKNENNLGL